MGWILEVAGSLAAGSLAVGNLVVLLAFQILEEAYMPDHQILEVVVYRLVHRILVGVVLVDWIQQVVVLDSYLEEVVLDS